jgi:hypothetical protein
LRRLRGVAGCVGGRRIRSRRSRRAIVQQRKVLQLSAGNGPHRWAVLGPPRVAEVGG